MTDKTTILIIAILASLLFISGCTTTSCIPVAIEEKYHADHEPNYDTAIINGTAFGLNPRIYNDIEVGKLNRVRFYRMDSGATVIWEVCK